MPASLEAYFLCPPLYLELLLAVEPSYRSGELSVEPLSSIDYDKYPASACLPKTLEKQAFNLYMISVLDRYYHAGRPNPRQIHSYMR